MQKIEKLKGTLLVLFLMVSLMLNCTGIVYADELPQEPIQQEQT